MSTSSQPASSTPKSITSCPAPATVTFAPEVAPTAEDALRKEAAGVPGDGPQATGATA